MRKATPTRNKISPPRLKWIKAFAESPGQQRAVHFMPEILVKKAQPGMDRWNDGKRRPRQKGRMWALSLRIAAVSSAILFRGSAVRATNLRGLTFRGPDAQIFFDQNGNDVTLSISGELVENGLTIEYEYDPDARAVIEWYLSGIRPKLIDDHPYRARLVDSDFLFPSTRAGSAVG